MVTAALGLEPRGMELIHTASTGGGKPINIPVVDMAIILLSSKREESPLLLSAVPVMETKLFDTQGIHALIGQDVLARCTLVHSGPDQIFHLMWPAK